MTVDTEFHDFLRDQLAGFGPFEVKRMFGGSGLFRNGIMFALIVRDGTFHFRVDDTNRPDYEATGMPPFTFQHKNQSRRAAMPYYVCPPEVMEDADEFSVWAEKAWAAAVAAAKEKKPRKRKG